MRLRTERPKISAMVEFRNFRDVVELWPSREAMAADVSEHAWVISKWWQRRSIPADRWSVILLTDRAREAGLTSDTLIALAAREPAEVRA